LAALLSLFFVLPLSAQEQSRVLAIFTDRSDMTANVLVEQTIRSTLLKQFDVRLDFHAEYLGERPFPAEEYGAFRDHLIRKYHGTRFDVILAVVDDAIQFVLSHAPEVFPGVPIVVFGGRNVIEDSGKIRRLTGVLEPSLSSSFKEGVEFIRTLQPGVREIFVVSGAAASDLSRAALARQVLGGSQTNVTITYLGGLSFENLQLRLSSLPPNSAILFLSMREDGDGDTFTTASTVGPIARSANAPVYALSGASLGSGILASVMTDQEAMSRETAEILVRILRGVPVEEIPIRNSNRVVMADWREIRRWNIEESNVPPNAYVRYREPTFWDAYKWYIIGVLGMCFIEGLLIVALLFLHSKRKRAEAAARQNEALLQSTIDALHAHVALLDEKANIIAVNEAWRRFASENGYRGDDAGVGQNYLEACVVEEAQPVAEGIQGMIDGRLDSFSYVYECSFGEVSRWFQLRMDRFVSNRVLRLVLAHENVTEVKRANELERRLGGILLRARDDERRRIARDLHDVTVQNLAAMKAGLAVARPALAALEGRKREMLAESLSLCDQVIDELRTLSYLLHPPLLDEVGLAPAVQWYVRGFIERSGIQIKVDVADSIGRFPSELETALFRVIQEALVNIHRHSGSRNAHIVVSKDRGHVVVCIRDDGCGILEPPANGNDVESQGVGILGMRERLRQFGGRLEIESSAHGTMVTAIAPIPEECHAAVAGGR
jgi:PAS domain S-box-containing protein